MECIICNAANPDGKKFCGDCGSSLDPVVCQLRTDIEASLKEKIDAVIRERFQDQKVVDIETTEKIFTRLSSWAQMFGAAVGIPLGILAMVFTLLGWKSVSDVNTKVQEVEKTAKGVMDSIRSKEADVEKLANSFRVKEEKVTEEMERVRVQLTEAKGVQKNLEAQVERIEKKVFQYEASSALTPDLERKLNESVARFRAYLEGVGFKFQEQEVAVYIDPNLRNAHYSADKKRLVLGAVLANDSTVLFREFTHHALAQANNQLGPGFADYNSIESGLADYFAASFTGDPAIGRTIVNLVERMGYSRKPYIRTMDNNNRFSDLKADTELHEAGETLCGALWEIRRSIGAPTADRLIFSAWVTLTASRAIGNPMQEFAEKLLEAAAKVEEGKHVKTMEQVFTSRGLKVSL